MGAGDRVAGNPPVLIALTEGPRSRHGDRLVGRVALCLGRISGPDFHVAIACIVRAPSQGHWSSQAAAIPGAVMQLRARHVPLIAVPVRVMAKSARSRRRGQPAMRGVRSPLRRQSSLAVQEKEDTHGY